ncbi:MAG: Crp/Fnr family transcriptional regulator [Bacteroidetes bacterium]|nr:Crp/Fnr family transcriptional regulator [Bacteroidota bacterium]
MGLIAHLHQFCELDSQAISWLENHVVEGRNAKGTVLLECEQVCNHLFFIKSGLVCGILEAPDQDHCTWLAEEQALATSYYSFISRKPSPERIEALEDTHWEALSYSDIEVLYQKFPPTERAGRKILEAYYAQLEERWLSLQLNTAAERYKRLLDQRPQLLQRVSLGKIASYLGMKQETLSRIRAGKS